MAKQSSPSDPIAQLRELGYETMLLHHAHSILSGEFPAALTELSNALTGLRLPISEIIGSGGGETKFTQRLRHSLTARGWPKHNFEITKTIDGTPRESTSHEVDHVKHIPGVGVLGCEIEWNNKDPFFDRDLENFKRLHAEGAISVGVIITRGPTLQDSMYDMVHKFAMDRGIVDFDTLTAAGVTPTPRQKKNIEGRVNRKRKPVDFAEAWTTNFVGNKFGQATTHWAKLMDRVHRGVGSPCPLLLLGLPASLVVFDTAVVEPLAEDSEAEAEGAMAP